VPDWRDEEVLYFFEYPQERGFGLAVYYRMSLEEIGVLPKDSPLQLIV
jgi:hypothetical protein